MSDWKAIERKVKNVMNLAVVEVYEHFYTRYEWTCPVCDGGPGNNKMCLCEEDNPSHRPN